jgi:polyphosphate glucokinase
MPLRWRESGMRTEGRSRYKFAISSIQRIDAERPPGASAGRGFAKMKKQAEAGARKSGGRQIRTLAVDIGGTGIKAETLDEKGRPINERQRIATPADATPRKVISVIRTLAKTCAPFERVSVGFPGVIKDGVVYTAPNLGKGWNGFELEKELRQGLKRPVRVANDADVQGLGCVSGRGVELVITLGTGVGSVIFVEGHRIHMELGHHPFHKGKTYEDELGVRAFEKKGRKKWNKLLGEALDDLARTFQYDSLYIGGGNAKHIKFKLPANVKTVSNTEGLLGGIKLWDEEESRRR